jgi:hypothetical protein
MAIKTAQAEEVVELAPQEVVTKTAIKKDPTEPTWEIKDRLYDIN